MASRKPTVLEVSGYQLGSWNLNHSLSFPVPFFAQFMNKTLCIPLLCPFVVWPILSMQAVDIALRTAERESCVCFLSFLLFFLSCCHQYKNGKYNTVFHYLTAF